MFFELTAFEQRLLSAENILNSLKNVHMKIFYEFLSYALPKFVHLNAFFQSDKVVILQIQQKIIDCFKDILMCYMNRSYVVRTEIKNIDPTLRKEMLPFNEIYLGVEVMESIKAVDNNLRNDIYSRCQSFFITSCMEILKRFDMENPFINNISIFCPTVIKKPSSIINIMREFEIFSNEKSTNELQTIDDE